MSAFSKVLILLAVIACALPSVGAAQYYVKKKPKNAEEKKTEQPQKPEAEADKPLQADKACTEEDLKNARKLDKGLEDMKEGAANKNPRQGREMIDYLSKPENIKYMTELYTRCARLL